MHFCFVKVKCNIWREGGREGLRGGRERERGREGGRQWAGREAVGREGENERATYKAREEDYQIII